MSAVADMHPDQGLIKCFSLLQSYKAMTTTWPDTLKAFLPEEKDTPASPVTRLSATAPAWQPATASQLPAHADHNDAKGAATKLNADASEFCAAAQGPADAAAGHHLPDQVRAFCKYVVKWPLLSSIFAIQCHALPALAL